ncbi:kunitz trypsin inhibitor 5-like [Henckelia pumila]|uniref:kunitz trypsin inhibitor 5-like n=1 Tax=Henckelia pumila TaxID=405737 RepID=UPI003C6E63D0
MKNDVMIFSFITLLMLLHTATQAQGQGDAVLDWDGNAVMTGETYYVLSVTAFTGGLEPYVVSNETCPYGVSQSRTGDGIPVKFSAADQGCVIHEDADLDISFSSSIECSPSNLWKKGDYDNATQQYFVTIGGIVGDGAFQIQRIVDSLPDPAAHHYKLVYCPKTCACCIRSKCNDVEIYDQFGDRRLAVITGKTSFNIVFYRNVPKIAKY